MVTPRHTRSPNLNIHETHILRFLLLLLLFFFFFSLGRRLLLLLLLLGFLRRGRGGSFSVGAVKRQEVDRSGRYFRRDYEV
jgi:hypothetical protein